MKKDYIKPYITAESLQLDSPVALSCDAQGRDNYKLLKEMFSCFTQDDHCEMIYTKELAEGEFAYYTANIMMS